MEREDEKHDNEAEQVTIGDYIEKALAERDTNKTKNERSKCSKSEGWTRKSSGKKAEGRIRRIKIDV